MEVLQVQSELDQMVELYAKVKPKRVLEIGCWDGGTLKEWMTAHTPDVLVAVDFDHRNRDQYPEWLHPDTNFHCYAGDSQSDPVIESMRSHAPYDWVFIDGDHGDAAVAADVQTCLPLVRKGGLLLMHDVRAGSDYGDDYGPRKVLRNLANQGFLTWEWVDPAPSLSAHGIGVVQL